MPAPSAKSLIQKHVIWWCVLSALAGAAVAIFLVFSFQIPQVFAVFNMLHAIDKAEVSAHDELRPLLDRAPCLKGTLSGIEASRTLVFKVSGPKGISVITLKGPHAITIADADDIKSICAGGGLSARSAYYDPILPD